MEKVKGIGFKKLIIAVALLLYCRYMEQAVKTTCMILFFDDTSLMNPRYYDVFSLAFYAAWVLLANVVAINIMDQVILYLSNKEVLQKFCPSLTHVMFYAQLISIALLTIVPRYFIWDSFQYRIYGLFKYGIPILLGLYAFAYLACFLPEKAIKVLWVNLSVIFLGLLHIKYYHFPAEAVITLITMTTLPIQQYLHNHKNNILQKIISFFYISVTENYDPDEEEEDEHKNN